MDQNKLHQTVLPNFDMENTLEHAEIKLSTQKGANEDETAKKC